MTDTPLHSRIMVPLDGSKSAERALPTALDLARRTGARVDLVGVISPHTLPPPRNADEESFVQGWFAEEDERIRSYLADALSSLDADDLEVRTHARKGVVVETLLEWSQELDTDLVVMTTHGRGGLRRAWLGSVSDALLRRAPWPILLVPASDSDDEAPSGPLPLQRMVVPLDGSARSEGVLGHAARLARLVEGTLSLVTVLPRPSPAEASHIHYGLGDGETTGVILDGLQAYVDGKAEKLRKSGLTVTTAARQDGSAADGIIAHAHEVDAQLILLATRGRGGVTRMMLGSVADKVIRECRWPILVHRVPNDLEDGSKE